MHASYIMLYNVQKEKHGKPFHTTAFCFTLMALPKDIPLHRRRWGSHCSSEAFWSLGSTMRKQDLIVPLPRTYCGVALVLQRLAAPCNLLQTCKLLPCSTVVS